MGDIYASPTSIIRYETCPKQQFFYRHGWRQQGLSDTMHFGNAAHNALEVFHRAETFGLSVDLQKLFTDAFLRPLATNTIRYGASRDKESLLATGRTLMEQFPEVWKATGLHAFLDNEGPLVERKYRVRIPKANVVLVGKIDLAAIDQDGRVFLLDNKTPGQTHDTDFTASSDQMLVYQAIFEAHAHQHGIERIDGVGIHALERRKVSTTGRGEGPVVREPDIVERRADADVQEYLTKVADYATDMRNGRFPKRPLHEHNSPCKLCEYAGACRDGDFSGLVNNRKQQVKERDAQSVAA